MSSGPTWRPAERGFWDYTTPGAGGMEGYGRDDYQLLLDDMSRAGMNSICVSVKWITTGYRSALSFLDQHRDNRVTQSDNELLRTFLAGARQRGMRCWLTAVATIYPVEHLASKPTSVHRGDLLSLALPQGAGIYDLDRPEVADYAQQMFVELVTLFPGVDGVVVELEGGDVATPERAGPYNDWASANGEPAFEEINRLAGARPVPIGPWRRYTTHRRAQVLTSIERAVRAAGFGGELGVLCENYREPYLINQEVDLELLRRRCPRWHAVTYEYSYHKQDFRRGMMELAIESPKRCGFRTYYLPRGVMTYAHPEPWPLPTPLEECWRRDLEDIRTFQPEGVWWFGSGCVEECGGVHTRVDRLRQIGYDDAVAARRRLLDMIGAAGF